MSNSEKVVMAAYTVALALLMEAIFAGTVAALYVLGWGAW